MGSISIIRMATGERCQYLTVVELLESTVVERFVVVEERVNTALDEEIEKQNVDRFSAISLTSPGFCTTSSYVPL